MNGGKKHLHYRLTLTAPAIVTNNSEDQHSAETQLFIPGNVIRGVIADLLLNDGCDPSDDEFQTLIFSGQVCYLDAYPEVEGARTMPTPLSWRQPKEVSLRNGAGSVEIIDLSAEEDIELFGEPFDFPFVSPGLYGGRYLLHTLRTGMHFHHQRDRQKGRAWKDGEGREYGTIFRYQYLEAGQTFRGVIVFSASSGTYMNRVKELLQGRKVLIGRSRRAGYGGNALIEIVSSSEREYGDLSGGLMRDVQPGDTFLMLFVSRYVGRDGQTGQIDPMAVEWEIGRLFNGKVEITKRFWRFEVVGGFRRKWRLELPQVLAVSAGSVFVLKANAAISTGLLRQVEDAGLGERKVEGFGRIVFVERGVWNGRLAREYKPQEVDISVQEGSKGDDGVLLLVERRLLMRAALERVEQQAAMIARESVHNASSIPSTTVLNCIRAVLRDAWTQDRASRVLGEMNRWCTQQGGHGEEAKKKLRQFHMKLGQNLLSWLEKYSGEHRFDHLVSECRLKEVSERYHLSNGYEGLQMLRNAEAVLCARLIDGVLASLARHSRMLKEVKR